VQCGHYEIGLTSVMIMSLRQRIEQSPEHVMTPQGARQQGQGSFREPGTGRHKTLDFDLWNIFREVSTVTSLTFNSGTAPNLVLESARHKSDADEGQAYKEDVKIRVPCLGPTRQQTELYMKTRANQHVHRNR